MIECPNFPWKLFVRVGVYYADGRSHGHGKHSLGTRDRSKAIESLFELDRLVWNARKTKEVFPENSICSPASHKSISIEAGWEAYIEKKSIPIYLGGLKDSSTRKYRGHSKRFIAYCKKKGIEDWSNVNQQELEAYGVSLDGKLSPITIHDDLTMEISVSNWLIKNGHLPNACKINWELNKPEGAEQYCYERNEVQRMLQWTLGFNRRRWMYPLVFLLSHTGVRISEAINLKWKDIDFKNEVIHIRDETYRKLPKGQERRLVKAKKSRIVPIHAALMECIEKQKAERVSDYFLPGKDGRKRSYSHTLTPFTEHVVAPLSDEFPTPAGELGFKHGRFHSFRHFFVSECFAAGIPECDIKDWVGHSDSKIVALYRHIRSETAKANMRLGDFGAT